MERVVSVNGTVENRRSAGGGFDPHPTGDIGWGDQDEVFPEVSEDTPFAPALRSSVAGSTRTCLYFGPRGERCSRPALANGFCAAHQPGAAKEPASPAKRKRILGAIIGIIGVLWPLLSELFHELSRWMHPH
ncbi:MAG TPA: hypothetical protein VMU43_04955 [Candidatus Acidoferrum sp.]|nr:hypothetical protein [Candidatus Acidoferrum sp.]